MARHDVAFGSLAEVQANIVDLASRLDDAATRFSVLPRTDRTVVLENLCRASAAHVRRLVTAAMGEADLAAWATRSLFELNLIVRYVLKSDSNLNSWLVKCANDERATLEALLSNSDGQRGAGERILRDRLAAIQTVVDRHGLGTAPKWPRTFSDLAAEVGVREEYAALYKAYSSYVHPSSWLVNTTSDRHRTWLSVFLFTGQRYGGDSLDRFGCELDSRSS